MRQISRCLITVLVLASCASHQSNPPPGAFPKLSGHEPNGVLHLHFRSGYTKAQQNLITGKLMPYLDQVFGRPWQTMNIDVYGSKSSPSQSSAFSHFDNSACSQGKAFGIIQVKDPSDPGALANELTHAHHGCFTFSEERFEEGFSYAGNILATYHLGLKQNPCTPYLCVGIFYQPNNRPGIGGGTEFDHDTTGYLSDVREEMGGMAWSQFETDHPGFLKSTNSLLYQELYHQQQADGGHIRGSQLNIDPYKAASGASSEFSSWYAKQHIFDGRPRSNNVFLLAENAQVVVIATKRNSQSAETPLNSRVSIEASVNGREGREGSLSTSGGVAYINLPKNSKTVKISVKVGRLADRVSYIATWPNSPYLGDVPLKP